MKKIYTEKQGQYLTFIHYYGKISRMRAVRGRDAAVLSSFAAFRAPDDFDARSARPHQANAGAGPIHPSADPA